MALNKPNQELRRELKELGFAIEQAADAVLRITKDCRDVEVSAVLVQCSSKIGAAPPT
ncbi:hypothetical protein [Pseudomonas serbica]